MIDDKDDKPKPAVDAFGTQSYVSSKKGILATLINLLERAKSEGAKEVLTVEGQATLVYAINKIAFADTHVTAEELRKIAIEAIAQLAGTELD